jgi:hypothetical protein
MRVSISCYLDCASYYIGIMGPAANSQPNITHKNIPIAVHTLPPDDEQINAGNM